MLAPGAARHLLPVVLLLLLAVLTGVVAGGTVAIAAGLVAAALAALVAFLAVFFRDPERTPGDGIVSAADGTVRAVERSGERWTISVFLGPLNVHVNRLPIGGTVEAIAEAGRGFRPAFRPEAASNAARSYRLRTEIGPVEVIQIVGVVARRLVSFVRVGATLRKGERFGMILLGSRVDVLLPAERVEPTVRVGDRVRAGASTIARIRP
ncbi:MAG TPA: phosphatidylserine decarboxylase [Thermoplasmata archaeon]|nr:phosphatidylserine decarboxylase [Thermoplasmata archaeon]